MFIWGNKDYKSGFRRRGRKRGIPLSLSGEDTAGRWLSASKGKDFYQELNWLVT